MTHLWIISLEIPKTTKKKWKTRILKKMLGEGAVIHFPRNYLLAGQEINGVWQSLSLDGQNRPKQHTILWNTRRWNNNVDLNGSTIDLDETEAKKETFKKGKSKSHLFEDEGKTLYNYTRPRVKLQQWKPERMQHKKEIQKTNTIKN